jgi:hypothetical protein
MMHVPLVIAMVAIAPFSQKMDSCCSANDRFNCVPESALLDLVTTDFSDLSVSTNIKLPDGRS